MRLIADFHIHSRYSRATSSQLDLDQLALWARYKGISLLGTGDCTHPLWMQEIQQKLQAASGGLYEYKGVYFVLTAEVNTTFYAGGKGKRIHHVLILPSIEAAQRLNERLGRFGDLLSDGRPTLSLSATELVKLALDVSPEILIVPAHAWTPHFSVFGAFSGFDSVEECFGDQAKEIFCLETGLSSDPAMNWRLSGLDKYTLISNSDSHSATRIGREANVFDCEPSYRQIVEILKTKDRTRFLYTIEFFPEEGKYHLDGHRMCKVRATPRQTAQYQNRCPSCGKRLTIGVAHRVEELADRPDGYEQPGGIPFKRFVTLDKIIADSQGVGIQSKVVMQTYLYLVQSVGTEFEILVDLPESVLREKLPAKVAEGVMRVRSAQLEIDPGYDGEYGDVKIFSGEKEKTTETQMTLF
ncbi:MAG: endonuclease Q family protein [Candidatus Omnitrophica bacterium]|nr:endonuclease Q family protein [Candidatus Omnitrophota bacterium]